MRDLIRRAVAFRLALTWPEDGSVRVATPERAATVEGIGAKIRDLSPQNESQRWLQSHALQIVWDVQQTRWMLFGGAGDSIQTPFLVVLVFWVTVIFASFGLFAPMKSPSAPLRCTLAHLGQ